MYFDLTEQVTGVALLEESNGYSLNGIKQAISVELSIPGAKSCSSSVEGNRLVASSDELAICTGSAFLEFTVPDS